MTGAMIEIAGLIKDYGPTRAIDNVSFEIPRGQVVGFLGPNGAGKSTAMKVLTGFVEATAGRVFVAGIDVVKQPIEARKHIGYLPESNPLYDEMMVEEYLHFMADMRGIPASSGPSSERAQRIQNAVEKCGLLDVRGKDIAELSKGFRQRVGLAQAILHDPDLLILDEPTTGLDPNQVVEIRSLITELGKEKTVLMSTHILPEVQATCSRVLIISKGQIVADDTPDNLSARSGRLEVEFVRRDGSAVNKTDVQRRLLALGGVTHVDVGASQEHNSVSFVIRVGDRDIRSDLFDVAVELALIPLRIQQQKISLEEIFRTLTTTAKETPSKKAA